LVELSVRAGPWLRLVLESAVDALPAAVQCQGVEGLHALAALPETFEMATAEEYSAALYAAAAGTIAAGTSWMQLLSLLGRPCIRLLHVITLAIAPTARDAAMHLGREAWAAAVLVGREAWAQPHLIAAAAAAFVALLLAWRLVAWLGRRRYIARASTALGRARCAMRSRYESFLRGTRRRSQWLGWVLATSLPHAGYVLACSATVRVAERAGVRARLQPLLWGATPLLTTYAPAVRTLLSLNVAADTQHWLRFWVVWACACTAAELWAELLGWVPFASQLLGAAAERAPLPPEEPLFCTLLWLQLNTSGVGALYRALAPRLLRRSEQLAALLPTLPAPAQAALTLFVGLMVPAELRRRLGDAMAEGGVLLGGLFFLMTPSPVARLGLLHFSLLHPALASVCALEALQGATPREPSAAVGVQLRYWMLHVALQACLALLAPLLRWLPLVTHARLVLALWLQLPHLRTTARLLGFVLGAVRGGGGTAALQERHPTPPQLPLLAREGTPERLPRPNAVYSSHLARRKLLPPGADDAPAHGGAAEALDKDALGAAATARATAEASDGGGGRASAEGGDGATTDSTSDE